jgi:hypothetical protein
LLRARRTEHDLDDLSPRRVWVVAEEGESGTTPLIELAVVASRLIPFVILMIGLIAGVYLLAGR